MAPRSAGTVQEGILEYWQEVTRKRGFPPLQLEIACEFGLAPAAVAPQIEDIHEYLTHLSATVELPKQHRPDVVNAVVEPQQLPEGPGQIDLKPFTGRCGWPNERDRMIYWHACAQVPYVQGSVDYMIHDEQVALTPETEAYFYSLSAVRLPHYEKGSRPFLERVAAETTQGCRTDRIKALALARLIGTPDQNPHVHRGRPDWQPFLGGTEEEILRKGRQMCNEVSRLLCVLCQITGMPARTVFAYTDPVTGVGSHAMTEIFFEGKWNLVEQNRGIMYLTEGGYFASFVEMRDHPEIVNARADVGGGLGLCHASFTGPASIVPYDLDRTRHYEYTWQ